MRIALKLALFLCVAGFSVAACHRLPPNAGSSAESALRIATSFKIQNLEPTKAAHYFLVEFGAAELPLMLDDNSIPQPWLLESYAQMDELNWRLTVRPNVKFHNGKLLTAERFAAAMNRQLERSPAAQTVLSGAKVKVAGEREIILTTDAPNPSVPAALADESVFPIYDVETVAAAGGDINKLIAGGYYTGAYRVVALDDRELKLERNADYWRGVPPLETVRVRFVPDAQARILAVQAGEADIALYPPTEAKRTLAGASNAFFVTSEASKSGPRLFFNVRRPPFDDPQVRRAFALGINYESLAQNVMDGVFDTATGFYPPSYVWAIQNQRTDAEAAKNLLDNAGWQTGADGIRAKNGNSLMVTLLVYPQQPDWGTLATAIQAQLRGIGFDVKIRQVDDIQSALKNPAGWDAGIISPGIVTNGGAPDPNLREHFLPDAENNYSGAADAELDELINRLSQTFDSDKRNALLTKIQEIIIAEKTYEVRPVFARSRAVVGKNYRNYRPSPHLLHVTFETKPDE